MPDDVHAESWSAAWQVAGAFGALFMGALLTALGFRSRRSDDDSKPVSQLDLFKLETEIKTYFNNEMVTPRSDLRKLHDRVNRLEWERSGARPRPHKPPEEPSGE